VLSWRLLRHPQQGTAPRFMTKSPLRRTTAVAMLAELVDGVIGVDTHRGTLATAALTP